MSLVMLQNFHASFKDRRLQRTCPNAALNPPHAVLKLPQVEICFLIGQTNLVMENNVASFGHNVKAKPQSICLSFSKAFILTECCNSFFPSSLHIKLAFCLNGP